MLNEAIPLHYLSGIFFQYYDDSAIYSTGAAFAAKMADGSVVTWGDARKGGDSSSVLAELKQQPVNTIYSTSNAFAAKMADGSVVTWGDAECGGDSSSVSAELKQQAVDTIYSTGAAFAAKMADGSGPGAMLSLAETAALYRPS